MISVSKPQDSKDGQAKDGMERQAVQPVPTPTRSTSGVPQTDDEVYVVASPVVEKPSAEKSLTESGAKPAPDDVPTVPEPNETVPRADSEKAATLENGRKAGNDYDQISQRMFFL